MAVESSTKTKTQSWVIELTLESGKDLEPPPRSRRLRLGRRMRTYAVVWKDPARKQFTRIDKHGGSNPKWNCKFRYRVMNQMIKHKINIEIYSAALGLMMRNRLIGTTSLEVQAIPDDEQPAGYVCNLEVKRPAAKAKANKAEAGLVHGGWINTRINVTPYQKPPPPPKRKESKYDSDSDDDIALGMLGLSLSMLGLSLSMF